MVLNTISWWYQISYRKKNCKASRTFGHLVLRSAPRESEDKHRIRNRADISINETSSGLLFKDFNRIQLMISHCDIPWVSGTG